MAGQLSEALSVGRAEAPTFDQVYAAQFEYVYRVLTRLVGSSEAEDMTQEVFLVVHRRLSDYRGDARITTWLFQIAYRVAGAHVRRSRLRKRLLILLGIETEANVPATSDGFAEAESVRSALSRLTFEKRSTLVLFEVEGWSCEEIAAATRVPLGTVYTRLHHARRDFACAHARISTRRGP